MITTHSLPKIYGLPEGIESKILVTDRQCWEWQGEIDRTGYGRAWYKGFRYMAHRIVYWLIARDTKPKFNLDNKKQELDHLCENRCCVNPYHLEVVTRKVNANRIHRRKKRIDQHGRITLK